MRRSDKEIKDKKTIKGVLHEASICRIALSDDNNPYLVSMNFGYDENCLYLHSAHEGRKIDILRKNNQVCFAVDIETEILKNSKPCNWGMRYLSVVGFGKAYFINNKNDKKQAFDVIMKKYSSETSFDYSDADLDRVTLIKIKIEKLTGKKSGY
ncbi:MAG TPA: pyridoxamine 5'-phosphate oxidase family protein [Methanobacteriaceae archaeon]|nr:pyridoxamine 5'-phosphate oxidase family protein [Methanobacteriaceae archaeon]